MSGVSWLRASRTLQGWGVSGTRTWAWCWDRKEGLSWPTVPDSLNQKLGKVQTGKNIFSFWWAVPGPERQIGTQEATGLAKLTQRVAGAQGGSEDPDFPLIPHCDLLGQAGWPATYLGHGLGLGMGYRVQGQDSAGERNRVGAGSAQNTNVVKRLEFQVVTLEPMGEGRLWGWG